jgi:hypothetical protein
MYYANRDAANAAESAANTASISLAQSQAAFKVEQRPYLVVDVAPQFTDPLIPGRTLHVNITYKNIGRSPANRIVDNFHLIKFHPPRKGAKGDKRFRVFINSVFASLNKENSAGREERRAYASAEQDVAPNQPLFTSTLDEIALSADELKGPIVTGEITLYCVGLMTYTDSFGGDYKTGSCYAFWGSDPKTWHVCDFYNIIR